MLDIELYITHHDLIGALQGYNVRANNRHGLSKKTFTATTVKKG